MNWQIIIFNFFWLTSEFSDIFIDHVYAKYIQKIVFQLIFWILTSLTSFFQNFLGENVESKVLPIFFTLLKTLEPVGKAIPVNWISRIRMRNEECIGVLLKVRPVV